MRSYGSTGGAQGTGSWDAPQSRALEPPACGPRKTLSCPASPAPPLLACPQSLSVARDLTPSLPGPGLGHASQQGGQGAIASDPRAPLTSHSNPGQGPECSGLDPSPSPTQLHPNHLRPAPTLKQFSGVPRPFQRSKRSKLYLLPEPHLPLSLRFLGHLSRSQDDGTKLNVSVILQRWALR